MMDGGPPIAGAEIDSLFWVLPPRSIELVALKEFVLAIILKRTVHASEFPAEDRCKVVRS